MCPSMIQRVNEHLLYQRSDKFLCHEIRLYLKKNRPLQLGDKIANFFLGLAEFLLQPTEELFILSFFEKKVIVRQVGKLLFKFAGSFFPAPLHAEDIHLIVPFSYRYN